MKTCPKCHNQTDDKNRFCVCLYDFEACITLEEAETGKTDFSENDVFNFFKDIINGKNKN